jgi:hypothetical protein
MSFVDHCLLYFWQELITCPLSALLPFQSLFTESKQRDQLLAPLPFSSVFRAPQPLCCVFLFSFFFIIQVFLFVCLFYVGQGSVCPEGYAGLSQE